MPDSSGPPESGLVAATLSANGTRLLVAMATDGAAVGERLATLRELAAAHLHDQGGVLFRGFRKGAVADFRSFAASFGGELLPYEFGSTPRSRIEGGGGSGVYSSTEYPAHQWIPQHNEQSYTHPWPATIWFYCDVEPQDAGETPLADSREVLRRIDPAVRRRFADKGLMYVRNYGGGLDLPWEQVFNTDDRAAVERFCRARDIAWEWLDDSRLRTRQIRPSEAIHPATGAAVWFNQAHLFHISALEPDLRETLLAVVDEPDLPRNVLYGDGSPIEDDALDGIRAVYQGAMLCFPWRDGDILLLDNMLMTHGRAPFTGPRRILVAMA